ncbi:MAG: KH domain-containing protein, partial [Candidatus Omnitrophota bacterium]|nr:KH domain-containing protein [Candidatus Omnitrophota bacterium]
MIESILIPAERIGVLKAKEGKFKREIETALGVKIDITDNSVQIQGEGLALYQAKAVVRAVGRGFSPPKAARLFDPEIQLEIIELRGMSERKAATIRARIIGSQGRTREMIESCSKAAVSVCGKTIAIIGRFEQIKNAKEAIAML